MKSPAAIIGYYVYFVVLYVVLGLFWTRILHERYDSDIMILAATLVLLYAIVGSRSEQ